MKSPAMNPYLRTKIMTAGPQQLRLMLYDGCLRYCEQGQAALAQRDYETSYESLNRAQQIVLELQNSLNHQVMPELCERLSALYTYVYRRLVDANIERQPSILDEVKSLISYERETWQMLMQKTAEEQGGAPTDTPASPKPAANPYAAAGATAAANQAPLTRSA